MLDFEQEQRLKKLSKKKQNRFQVLYQVELQKIYNSLHKKFGGEFYIPKFIFYDLDIIGKVLKIGTKDLKKIIR